MNEKHKNRTFSAIVVYIMTYDRWHYNQYFLHEMLVVNVTKVNRCMYTYLCANFNKKIPLT